MYAKAEVHRPCKWNKLLHSQCTTAWHLCGLLLNLRVDFQLFMLAAVARSPTQTNDQEHPMKLEEECC
jgi:hypothetical protein